MIAFTRKNDKHFLKARTLKLSPSLSPSSPLPPDDNSSPPATLSLSTCGVARSDSHRAVLDVKSPPAWESKGSPGGTRRSGREAYLLPSTQPCSALYIPSAHIHTHAAAWNFSRVPPSKRHMWLLSLRLAWDTSWSGTQAGAKAGVGH